MNESQTPSHEHTHPAVPAGRAPVGNGTLSTIINRPPCKDCFPNFPSSWYYFCQSKQLARKPVGKRILSRELVAFRQSDGKVVVLNGSCVHLGASLARGTIVEDDLQCPFHGWRFGGDGKCSYIPSGCTIPSFAQQAVYPVVERHGSIFFFNGSKASFDLPFFLGETPSEFTTCPPLSFDVAASWYLCSANGFDVQHLSLVHDRRLEAFPEIDNPAPSARRICYSTSVTGNSWSDLVIRRFIGNRVRVTITAWGGNVVVVTAAFRRATSYMLFFFEPLGETSTRCIGYVLRKRMNSGMDLLTNYLALRIRRELTRAFVLSDVNRIGCQTYSPETLIECDQTLIDYLNWVAELYSSQAETNAQHRDG